MSEIQFCTTECDRRAPCVGSRGKAPLEKLMPSIAAALQAHGCANVKVEVVKDSVHYVVDEQPEAVAELIERYAR